MRAALLLSKLLQVTQLFRGRSSVCALLRVADVGGGVAELRQLSWNSNTLGRRCGSRGMRVCCRLQIVNERYEGAARGSNGSTSQERIQRFGDFWRAGDLRRQVRSDAVIREAVPTLA